MTFVVQLALAIGLLILVPIVAHLLRRGRAKEIPFPPTRFIPPREHVARRRSRFEDRLLLTTRASIILFLALLGATPLLRCDHAVLTRHDGASVAVVLVLDDSASMRARHAGKETRFDRAKRAARDLVDQLEKGDSIGLVLAGKPARVLLLPTHNFGILSQQLGSARESDRSTDLGSAVALAESALDRQPQSDKRVLVLSDMGGELPALSARAANLLPELASVAKDCGIVAALRNRGRIAAEIACSKTHPNTERKLVLYGVSQPERPLTEKSFSAQAGTETVVFDAAGGTTRAELRLTGADENPSNDVAPVVDGTDGPSVATFSDPATGRGTTGGPPLIEQALWAIEPNLTVRPLPTVPEDQRELENVQLLLLDDPPALSAESRSAIVSFVERGGVAVAFFGPSASSAQLGSLVSPFVERRASWEATNLAGLDVASLGELAAAAASFSDIAPKGRFEFDESQDPKVVVHGRWSDQKQFWIERPLGRGIVMTVGLPASIGQSDLALRTGFVAMLERILATSERLGRARVTTVGKAWHFPNASPFAIEGPAGPVPLEETLVTEDRDERKYVPSTIGRYAVRFGAVSEERVALYPAEEILEPPHPWPSAAPATPNKAAGRLDLSRPLIASLIPLLLLELALGSAGLGALWRRAGHAFAERRRRRGASGAR